jgi:primosomal protein N''
MIQKLSTGLAITQLTWECAQLQEDLTASTEANAHLTDEEKRLLEKRYESIRRDLAAVMQKKEVLEKHLQPAIDALLSEYTAVQSTATRAGITAPAVVAPQMRYRTQQPAGYGR